MTLFELVTHLQQFIREHPGAGEMPVVSSFYPNTSDKTELTPAAVFVRDGEVWIYD